MEKRKAKVMFAKAGNGVNARMIIPIPWLREMGVDSENREVEIIFDKETKEITIKREN